MAILPLSGTIAPERMARRVDFPAPIAETLRQRPPADVVDGKIVESLQE
jgi:hypothetical protein